MREPAAALNPLLPGVIERAKRVGMAALDFEADVASDDESGLDVMRCNLEGVVICTGPNKADSTYIRIPPGADAELVNQLSPLTDDPHFLMLDHGGTYEDKWFIKLKKGGLPAIKCRRADTMRAFWLTDEDCPVGYSLKRIATHLWKVPRVTWKEARRTKLPGMGASFDDYGANDGLDTWNLWAYCEPLLKRDGLEKVFWDLEMGSRYAFSEMEYYGVPIDISFLKSQMGGLKAKVMAARKAFDEVVGRPVNLGSSQDLAMALYYHLRLPVDPEFIGSKVARLNDIFPHGVPSTAELVLKKLKLNGHNQVDPVLEFRSAEKDLEFYEGLLRYAEANFGYCYPSIFTLLKTGRCAYSDPCLQQLPRPDKSELRKAVRAPDGQTWVGADLSQIELRIMAHMSGDATLVRAYKEGLDIHKITAAACGTTRQEAKCVDPRAWVQVQRGDRWETVRIGDLSSNRADDVFTPAGNEARPYGYSVRGPGGAHSVKSFYSAGVKPTVRIEARQGILRCSKTHRLQMADGRLVPAGDVQKGDVLAPVSYGTSEGEDQVLRYNPWTEDPGGPFEVTLDDKWGYFAGMFTGDGCWLKTGKSVSIAVGNGGEYEVWKQKVAEALNAVGMPATIRQGSVYFGSSKAGRFIKALGLAGDGGKTFEVPPWVMGGTYATRMAFLAGMLDTDGCVGTNGQADICTKSWRLAQDLVTLVGTLGYSARVSLSWNARYQRNYYKVALGRAVRDALSQGWLRYPSKAARLAVLEKQSRANNPSQNTVMLVVEDGDAALVDLELHEEPHLYHVNGFTTHNSINFGFAYGLGWQKLTWMLLKDSNIVVDEPTAREWRANYFENYVGIQAYHEAVKAQIKEHGYVREMFGHYRRLKALYKENRSKAERVGINFTIQAAAGSLLKIIMRNIRRRLIKEGLHEKVRMRLQVHDELGFTCDNDVADYTQRLVKEEMEGALTLPHPKTGEMMHWLKVPLMAGVGSGASWYDAK